MTGGTIGILSLELSRYAAFHANAMAVKRPKHTYILWSIGKGTIDAQNYLARDFVGDWLWLLGDDHTFGDDALLNMLRHLDRHDVDIVVPVNVQRQKPFWPLLYAGDGKQYDWSFLDGKFGLHEVPASGNAGMLIRRRVFDKIPFPWFETGVKGCPYFGSDLTFCWKAREAGFKVWVDTDTVFGHIFNGTAVPARLGPDGQYGVYIQVQNQLCMYLRFRGGEEAVMFEQLSLEKILEEAGEPVG